MAKNLTISEDEIRKNSRAARHTSFDPTTELDDITTEEDSRTRVLNQLAEKELRSGKKTDLQTGIVELTAISRGVHPDQKPVSPGRVVKKGKKKDQKRKQQRAEMLKDILNEKIVIAKKRHKTVREYRADETEEVTKK